jgi:hypothetical protein
MINLEKMDATYVLIKFQLKYACHSTQVSTAKISEKKCKYEVTN